MRGCKFQCECKRIRNTYLGHVHPLVQAIAESKLLQELLLFITEPRVLLLGCSSEHHLDEDFAEVFANTFSATVSLSLA